MIAVIGTDWRVELPGRLRPNGHQARIKVAMRGKKKEMEPDFSATAVLNKLFSVSTIKDKT